jgi:hypothetical protein
MGLDANTAAQFGQQSSQPGSFPNAPQKSTGNEDLALALASMATNPAMQSAVLGGGLNDAGNSLQNSMLGGWGGTGGQQQSSPVSTIFGGIQQGAGAVNTGVNLYNGISKLYDSIFNSPDWSGVNAAGDALTSMNLASDLSSTAPAALDMYDWWTWA